MARSPAPPLQGHALPRQALPATVRLRAAVRADLSGRPRHLSRRSGAAPTAWGARLRYYGASLPTLLAGITNWPGVLLALLRGPAHAPFVVALRGGLRFRVRGLLDLWIVKETCLDRDYDAGLEPGAGWTVVDIGAGLGDFALHAARRFPGCRVLAYEPFPESFDLLQANVALNGVQNVDALPLAVCGRPAACLPLYCTGAAVQHTTIPPAGPSTARTVPVQTTTLDRICARLPAVDFLKLDCEGAEYEILFRARPATLARVERIALEYHDGCTPYAHSDLARYLQAQGFRVRYRSNPAHRALGYLYARRRTR